MKSSPHHLCGDGRGDCVNGRQAVDIEPDTCNIDASKIEAKIFADKAIMPVSLRPSGDMDEINAIAAKHNVAVIEDAAQSFVPNTG